MSEEENESIDRMKCYKCNFRREVPGNAHSACAHPNANVQAIVQFAGGRTAASMQGLEVEADAHGVQKGWFMWPLNFDPCWLVKCTGFSAA